MFLCSNDRHIFPIILLHSLHVLLLLHIDNLYFFIKLSCQSQNSKDVLCQQIHALPRNQWLRTLANSDICDNSGDALS